MWRNKLSLFLQNANQPYNYVLLSILEHLSLSPTPAFSTYQWTLFHPIYDVMKRAFNYKTIITFGTQQ
jgi:hypothetical protein